MVLADEDFGIGATANVVSWPDAAWTEALFFHLFELESDEQFEWVLD